MSFEKQQDLTRNSAPCYYHDNHMLQYQEIFPLAILFNNTLSTTDIQTAGILKEVTTQYKSNNIEKHNRSHLRTVIIHTRNLAYKIFWPKSISSEQDYTVQGAYKLSEDFAKPYFHKYWTEIHDVTTIWKRNVCSFIVTLNAFDVRPTCDTADVQTILPFPPNPPKRVLCDIPDCSVDALSQFWQCFWMSWDVNIVLDETPQEEITHCQVWWPG